MSIALDARNENVRRKICTNHCSTAREKPANATRNTEVQAFQPTAPEFPYSTRSTTTFGFSSTCSHPHDAGNRPNLIQLKTER